MGEAAEWAEANPLVQVRINKPDPTLEDVEALKTLLQDRFPQRLIETTSFKINTELESLKQQKDESLLVYYKRARSMMERAGAKDRTELGIPLTPLEVVFLDTVMRSFVNGISDMDIKRAAARGLTSATRSFFALYVMVEEAQCINTEIENMEAAEAKEAELQYYKSLAEKRLHLPSQPQVFNPRSNSLPSSAPKLNNRPSPNRSAGPTMGSQNQPQQIICELPPNLPDRTTSRNPFIKGTRTWTKRLGALCVSCGKCGHTNKQCTNGCLPTWERAYLKEVVFGDSPQASFVQLGSGDADYDTSPFGCHNIPAPYQSSAPYEITRSNSVSVGWDNQPGFESELNQMSVNAFYGENSGAPNKRRPNMVSEVPVEPFNTFSQPQSVDRPKQKGEGRVGKKTEPTPLAGMRDEIFGSLFDKPVSVREVLKRNREAISLMD